MANKYVATIDCGSSNVRCIVFNVDTGKQVSVAAREWYVPKNSKIAGAYDFDSDTNWDLVCECTQAALAAVDVRDIAVVTASGFRHGIFCESVRENKTVYGCFNMDSRTDCSFLYENDLQRRIFDITGDWPSLHGLPRLLWIKKHDPIAFEQIDKVMLISDWLTYRFCGEIAIEPGDASSTLLMELATRKWSEEIVELCGLPRSILPKVVEPGTIIGKIDSTVAVETGFAAGTPVTVGVADTQAGLIGVGAVNPGDSALVGGTYWMSCHVTDKPYVDTEYRMRTSCHSNPKQWVFEGVGFLAGLTVRWFLDAFGAQEKQIGETYHISPYKLLDRLTEGVPAGSYGVQALLADVANQQKWMMCSPTFIGWDVLNPETSHKGVFFKAILENACYQSFGEFENIRRISGNRDIPEKLIICGGAAHSDTWCKIIADVMGKPVSVPAEREGTALGAAILAMVGCGLYRDTQEAAKVLTREQRVFDPNMANHTVYMDAFYRWQELYKNGLTLVERGLAKPMWQSPATITQEQRQNLWKL